MKIVTTRRICQIFFLFLFVWFCIVTTLGDRWWQLRGWPVNWIIQLDPLVGLATLLTTRTVYAGLLWGLATMVLTIVLGRFFCGWICPFGTIHQFVGFLAKGRKSTAAKIRLNQYHPAQWIKYWILIFLLTISTFDLAIDIIRLPATHRLLFLLLAVLILTLLTVDALRHHRSVGKRVILPGLALVAIWLLLGFGLNVQRAPSASLQIGLLDPIPLVYRSINLIIMPLLDRTAVPMTASARLYAGTWLIAVIFMAAVLLNLKTPRFYCRFICPAGALFGVLSRFSLWRIGKSRDECTDCRLCEKNCEGACEPTTRIRISECVLCMNCLDECRHGLMTYQTAPSASGEVLAPDLSRRQFMVSAVSGAAAIPMLRISGGLGPDWNPALVRPPGALPEVEFLSRCIKCGQCMRICPTNVIHPAGLESGLEGLWTPILNFRIGTSGCQHRCIACGHLCPTAAIRPISLAERMGHNEFKERGPIKIGTAFIDRGRCLPWAMDRPCIVCQENCPVSPKAIITRQVFNSLIFTQPLSARHSDGTNIELETDVFCSGCYGTGDYFCVLRNASGQRRHIIANDTRTLRLSPDDPLDPPPSPGTPLEIQIRLQQPYVDPRRCIGCGICEHECPVPGLRAIRVTADGESREQKHALSIQF